MSDLCPGCFPPLEDVAALARRARGGEPRVAVVGDGSPGTSIGCQHGSWVLGDLLGALEGQPGPNGCTGTKADGSACGGRAGEDGRCAAHKDTP